MKINKKLIFLLLVLSGVIYFASNFEAKVESQTKNVPTTESELKLRKEMIIKNLKLESGNSNYVYFGDGTKQPVIFVHGTPGSFGAFFDVMSSQTLQENFDMVSIDRLGWNTAYIGEGIETDFRKQAEYIKRIKDAEFPNKTPILVGHSLGGSIIPMVLMDYPESFSGMLIIAGTIDPELGKPRFYNYLADTFLAKAIISETLQRSNDEIMDLEENLKHIEGDWSTIDKPVSVIQGMDDYLVSPKNTDFARQKLSHLGNLLEIVEITDAGHFLIWENIEEIEKSLIRISLENTKRSLTKPE